jgi:hypothetical protein
MLSSCCAISTPVRLADLAMMVADLAHTINRRLKRFVPFRHGSSGMGALALPAEIILMIASLLDKVSTISLALTCRRLHSLCFTTALSLDRTEKETLLILLEQDEPRIYFCPRRTKLHNWYTRWNRSILPYDIEERCHARQPMKTLCIYPTSSPSDTTTHAWL